MELKFVSKYLNHLTLEGKATNTIKTYSFHLESYRQWLGFSGHELEEVRPMDLIDFKEFLLRKEKSERTINAILSCLRGYYDFLILHEVAKTNPVSNLLRMKVQRIRKERLTDEELHVFYTHIDTLKPNIRAAFYLMIGSGARVGEVANLTKSDITTEDGKLFIDIQDAKWGSDRRIPVLSKKSAEIVHDYLQNVDITSYPAFRVSKRTLQTHATIFAQQTNINFSCHILRHTFATILKEKEVPIEKIQYLLGHRTASATAHYTQSANVEVKSLAPSIWQQ